MGGTINTSIVICLSLLLAPTFPWPSYQPYPELPVLRFGTTAPTSARKHISHGAAVAMPGVALFLEGHSHGNVEHYATLANIHSDSLPSCLCPALRQRHLSFSAWDMQGLWPEVEEANLLFRCHRSESLHCPGAGEGARANVILPSCYFCYCILKHVSDGRQPGESRV